MKIFFKWLFVCLSWIHLMNVVAQESESGVLIVTYETGQKGERLERIRFRLDHPNGEHSFYPQKNGSVDNSSSSLSRMVAIEGLSPGLYLLEFIVPNCDGLFEKVEPREVSILPGKTCRIDQVIKPLYTSLKVIASVETFVLPLEEFPHISLKNSLGQTVAQASSGKLICEELPAGNYTVLFGPLTGYVSPGPVTVQLRANEANEPIVVTYSRSKEY